MFANIVAAGIIAVAAGAATGLVVAVVGSLWRLGESAAPRKLSLPLLAGAAALVVGSITAVSATGARRELARRITTETEGVEILSIPGVKERVDGKSPEEVRAITQKLSLAGMLKLEDEYLVRRARLLLRMLNDADEQRCARLAVGSLLPSEQLQMVLALPAEEQAAWFEMVRAAIATEVGARAAPEVVLPTSEQVATALSELVSALPEADRGRFTGDLMRLTDLAPDEACWAARALYSLVTDASATTQATMARALMMQ